jgi:hypothetical protein
MVQDKTFAVVDDMTTFGSGVRSVVSWAESISLS